MNKFIVNAKKLALALHLGIIWGFLDSIKFEIEKRNLQLKARFQRGSSQLKKELLLFYGKGKPYQSFAGSDFSDLPFLREGEVRFKIIKENLATRKGTLLDIGSNLGYFCHKFEEEGFDCYALEENKFLCYFIDKLKKAGDRHFKVVYQSIFDYKKGKDLVFDVVLALSVFHHFLKTEEGYFNLINLLKRIRTREFFFEPHLPAEFEGKAFYKNYTPDEFVNFIIKNSCFGKARLIGKSEKGRPIYKLT